MHYCCKYNTTILFRPIDPSLALFRPLSALPAFNPYSRHGRNQQKSSKAEIIERIWPRLQKLLKHKRIDYYTYISSI